MLHLQQNNKCTSQAHQASEGACISCACIPIVDGVRSFVLFGVSRSPSGSQQSMSSNASNNGLNDSMDDDAEWRTKVQQSYRNTEVRQIAKVLASLEPGASEASKLRLAMQFEDSVFKLGTSLADYHKRLTKRLKKLEKNYVPVVDANAPTREKERVIQELISKYGDDVKYIVKNAAAAIKEMKEKYGEDKAAQLQQHTEGVKLWAVDMGLVDKHQPNYGMSDQHLEKLKGNLEKRLQNVRSHTVKLVDPDAFLQETLQRTQDEFKDKGRVVRIQAENMRKRYEQMLQVVSSAAASTAAAASDFTPAQLLAQALEQAHRPVPPMIGSSSSSSSQGKSGSDGAATTPRAGNTVLLKQSEVDARVRTAVLHLDKMRGASSVVMAYLCAPDKYSVPSTALVKAHCVAMAGIEVVRDVMREHRERQQTLEAETVHLEDAWLKPIVVPVKEVALAEDDATGAPSAHQLPKLANRLVLRTRVLLTAGRKTPSNLVAALLSKGVTLVRPPPSGAGSYAQLNFERAFVMTIYFVPLLVTLRAYRSKPDADATDDGGGGGADEQDWKCGSWTPLHYGLPDREELTVGGAVKGTYETIGMAVEERLRDASAHATHALRTFFYNTVTANGDFEVELVEASALLEFIQLTRDTFMPNWKEDTSN